MILIWRKDSVSEVDISSRVWNISTRSSLAGLPWSKTRLSRLRRNPFREGAVMLNLFFSLSALNLSDIVEYRGGFDDGDEW